MNGVPRPELVELAIGAPVSAWAELGFAAVHGTIELGGVRLRVSTEGEGIVSWVLTGLPELDAIDGLPTTVVDRRDPDMRPSEHPNGAIGLDHVVVVTADFDRTAVALERAGMPLRRIRTASQGEQSFRQGFRRLGPSILELVELKGPPGDDPARFWGLVVIVPDIDAVTALLGPERCGEPKDAVQPGRRIATVKRGAGISLPLAFMTPEPSAA
jgi:hypothetical protein